MKNKKESKALKRSENKAAKKQLKDSLTQQFFGIIKGLGYDIGNDKSDTSSITKLFAKRLTKALIKLSPVKNVNNETVAKTTKSKVKTGTAKPQTVQNKVSTVVKAKTAGKNASVTKATKTAPQTKRNTAKKA